MATKTILLTTVGAGTWTLPADCNKTAGISAIAIGGGGGGGRGTNNGTSGSGGGGGAWAKVNALDVSTLTPGTSTLFYSIGSKGTGSTTSGTGGTAGGDTWLNKTSNAAPASTTDGVLAKGGGGGGPSTTVGTGGSSTTSVGNSKFSGGNGGAGGGIASHGGGGGGAAGKDSANGGAGGARTVATGSAGGGGGGVAGAGATGGGTNGAGGSGGNNYSGAPPGNGGSAAGGAGGSGSNGAGGGGGGGRSSGTPAGAGGQGGAGTENSITAGGNAGSGGGGGGGGGDSAATSVGGAGGAAGNYGGGGGGGGGGTTTSGNGGDGAQGALIITYTVADITAALTGNAATGAVGTVVPKLLVELTPTFTVSSTFSGTSAAGNSLRDGNTTTTYWGSNNETNPYASVDLTIPRTIDRIDIACAPSAGTWGPSFTNGALIQYSSNGSSWTTALTVSGLTEDGGGTPQVASFSIGGISARYWRITKTGTAFLGVSEFRIHAWYEASASLTGVAATGAVGSVVANTTKALTGNYATGTLGSVVPGIEMALSGVAVTTSLGNITTGLSIGLTGAASTGDAGSPGVSTSVGLTGAYATTAVGYTNVSPTLSGVVATGATGALSPSLSQSLTGAVGTGSAGVLSVNTSVQLTSVTAVGVIGEEVPNFWITETGVSATSRVGVLTPVAESFTYVGIRGEIQKLNPSAIIELFEIDATNIGGSIYRFHNGKNGLTADITWQGLTYTAFPIEAHGFEWSGKGQLPRPTLAVSNVMGTITSLVLLYEDLIGCKVTRIRTLQKFLDGVNFPGGVNPTEDTTAEFPRDIYYVDRKSAENRDVVEFELAAAIDLAGIMLPNRQIVQNYCPWQYRGAECGWTGTTYYDTNDAVVVGAENDVCGKRLSSCKVRFGQYAELPYGGFPAAGLIKG